MRRIMMLIATLAMLFVLASCENPPWEHPTAQHALRVFCRLHQADIFATLLTPQQQAAGRLVCAAVGQLAAPATGPVASRLVREAGGQGFEPGPTRQ